MKPGPAISADSIDAAFISKFPIIASAIALGFFFAIFVSCIAAFVARSPCVLSFGTSSTNIGNCSRSTSPAANTALAIASFNVAYIVSNTYFSIILTLLNDQTVCKLS